MIYVGKVGRADNPAAASKAQAAMPRSAERSRRK
jgi:hypothetical protein